MTKEEKLDILIEEFTAFGCRAYKKMYKKLKKRKIEIDDLERENIGISRFLADMYALNPNKKFVVSENPKEFAITQFTEKSVPEREYCNRIFCDFTREFEGVFGYNKTNNRIYIDLKDGRSYRISVDRLI